MIEIKHVTFSYSLGQTVLKNISFSIKKGEFCAILGANGTGKTTLLKLILGKLKPQKGDVTFNGKLTYTISNWTNVGYVPQKMTIDSFHPAKVRELISHSPLCSHLEIEHLYSKQFNTLSGGQKQKVLLALALENDPDVLLLDEPTEGIDEKTRKQFYELLKHICVSHNKTVVIVSHDNEIIEKYVDRMLCIDAEHHFTHARCVHD